MIEQGYTLQELQQLASTTRQMVDELHGLAEQAMKITASLEILKSIKEADIQGETPCFITQQESEKIMKYIREEDVNHE